MVRRSMDEMAETHSRSGRCPVRPDLYRHWSEALLEAVQEHDSRMTPTLEQHWREALGLTTEHFATAY